MLSAHDLLGRLGGLDRDYTGSELGGPVNAETTGTNFDGDEAFVEAGERLPMPEAVPWTVDVTRDLAAYPVERTTGGIRALELAGDDPGLGTRVYVLADLGPNVRLFPAEVRPPVHGRSGYEVTITELDDVPVAALARATGAPVITADGEVVGLLAGTGPDTGASAWAVVNPVSAVRSMLTEALAR
jgi:hypothetical protein